MRTKLVAGIVALALVTTSVGIVYAHRGGPPGAFGQPSGPWWMQQLTEEQREGAIQQMQAFMQKQRQEAQEFRQQICAQYNITGQNFMGFVDEDGDGICDNRGMYGHGHRYGHGFRWLAETTNEGT
jgi:uncharacterized membrane protein